jgi:hypothetical protein
MREKEATNKENKATEASSKDKEKDEATDVAVGDAAFPCGRCRALA